MQGVDYVPLDKIIMQDSTGGQNRKEYALTLDTAKELSMMERTPRGKEARRYFIKWERIGRESTISQKPQLLESDIREIIKAASVVGDDLLRLQMLNSTLKKAGQKVPALLNSIENILEDSKENLEKKCMMFCEAEKAVKDIPKVVLSLPDDQGVEIK